MAVLDEKLQRKIDELIDSSYEFYQNNDYDKSFELQLKAWELFPNPKEQWSEAYNLAKYLFKDYLKMNNYAEAKVWLEKMICVNQYLNKNEEGDFYDEDVDFEAGKYNFEIGDFEEAYKLWREVVRQSGGKNHFRYFENENKKYLDFYTKQTKLRESK